MTRKKAVAAKEHKMLNKAKKYIKEQYILEPDEHNKHNKQESAQTIKLKELIARKAVDLFISNGLYYDKNLVLFSEGNHEDNKLFNFYSKRNDAYFHVTVTPKNTVSVRAYSFVEHREWSFNPNE